ncbi:MAG: hypothetical protein JWM59_1010 [Verrucomicrobiales bacterium]|nr:hypothetical protein [Verrucomicrobiales bacterium]
MTVLGDLEPIILRKQRRLLIPIERCQSGLMLLIVDIGETFEEQQRKDVALEIRRIHRPAQDVGGLPQMGFELGQSQHGK